MNAIETMVEGQFLFPHNRTPTRRVHRLAPPRQGELRGSSVAGSFYQVLAAGLILALPSLRADDESSSLTVAKRLNEAFVEVAEKVSPAVVVIEVMPKPDYESMDEGENPYLDMLPPELRRRMQEPSDKKHPGRSRRTAPGYDRRGSGIVIRKDGWILTNNHVVEGADKIRVRFRDGRTCPASDKWWTDPQSDIAVIRIDADDLPTAKLGDSSKTRVGEFAIAIGAPFELDYSVTFGHVSAKGRTEVIPSWGENWSGASMDQDFLQTDASINPGNSGGPLVNIAGEVIGINTLIRGMNRGIGFAIPSNLARQIANHLIEEGKFTRAWLGIQIEPLKGVTAFRPFVPGLTNGVVVRRILPNGPAARSGLKPADVILSVEGKAVSSAQELRYEVRAKKIGTDVGLEVARPDGRGSFRAVQLRLRTEEWPDETVQAARNVPKEEPAARKGLGVTAQALTKTLIQKYDLGTAEGVVVTSVDPEGPAAHVLFSGDLITEVNGQTVKTPEQLQAAVQTGAEPNGVLVHIVRNGAPEFRILKDGGD